MFAFCIGYRQGQERRWETSSYTALCNLYDPSRSAVWLQQVWQLLCTDKVTRCPLDSWETARSTNPCWDLDAFPWSRGLSAGWLPSRGLAVLLLEASCCTAISLGLLEAPWLSACQGEILQMHSVWAPILNTCMMKPSGLGRCSSVCIVLMLVCFSLIILCACDLVKLPGAVICMVSTLRLVLQWSVDALGLRLMDLAAKGRRVLFSGLGTFESMAVHVLHPVLPCCFLFVPFRKKYFE